MWAANMAHTKAKSELGIHSELLDTSLSEP